MFAGASTDTGLPSSRIIQWDTRAVHPGARITQWNDVASAAFTPLSIDAHERGSFHASLVRLSLGETVVARVKSEGSLVRHSRANVAADRNNPAFLLHFQVRGRSLNAQAGRTVEIGPGDCTVVDSTRPYSLEAVSGSEFIVCRFEAERFKTFLDNPDDDVACLIRGDSGATRTMHALLDTLWTEGMSNQDAEWLQQADATILSTLALAWRSSGLTHCGGGRTNRLQEKVKDYINRCFDDPDLSVSTMAHELSVSPRSIQKAFVDSGETPVQYVQKVRIKHAARLLSMEDMSVTDAAMYSGFNDLTHFGRVFKKITGKSPRSYRACVGLL